MNYFLQQLFLLCLIFAMPMFAASEVNMEIDFGKNKHGEGWRVINDGVMGGLSQGQADLGADSLIFQGTISLENNGGFSSLKSPFAKLDLSAYRELEIKYRHQGHPVAFTFEWHQRFFKPYHKVVLPETGNEWLTIKVALNQFEQFRLGQPTGKKMQTDDLKRVIRIGFIAGEKQETPFAFEVDYLKFHE